MTAKRRSKIRRYGNIYGRGMGSGSWQIVVAMIAGILLFGVIGWSLYTPIHDWMERLNENREIQSGSAAPVAPSQGVVLTPASSEVSPPSVIPPDTAPQPEPVPAAGMAGIYLPVSGLNEPSILSGFLERASAAALNTVVVEAKDATGTVLFHSKNEIARQLGAADANAYDPAAVAKSIRDAGMIPVARVHAFRDSVTPVYERAMGVRYYDTESLWFDNSPAQGGKPWLNPCSSAARQYLISLATELVQQGFEVILLDSVQFPSGLALDKAGYGVTNFDRAEVLNGFIAQFQKAVEEAGGRVIVCIPSDALLTGNEKADALTVANNQAFFGGNPAARMVGPTMITLSNDPAESKRILTRARAEGPAAEWIGLMPAYHSDGSLIGSTALLAGLDPAGYLLYNPQGNYQLQ